MQDENSAGAAWPPAALHPAAQRPRLSCQQQGTQHPKTGGAGGRWGTRDPLQPRNAAARPKSAAASYGALYAQRRQQQRLPPQHQGAGAGPLPGEEPAPPCELSPAGTVSIGDALLDSQDRALRAALQLDDFRLEALRRRSVLSRLGPSSGAGGDGARASGPQPAAAEGAQAEQHQRQRSIVRHLVAATGQGCAAVLLPEAGATPEAGACWTTRFNRLATMESYCILDLQGEHEDVCVRMAFASPHVVPAAVRLEHAPSPTAKFEELGVIRLQAKSLRQLRHMFRLGAHKRVLRVLRITCMGWLAREHAGMHRVSSLFVGLSGSCSECQAAAPPLSEQQEQQQATAAAWAVEQPAGWPQRYDNLEEEEPSLGRCSLTAAVPAASTGASAAPAAPAASTAAAEQQEGGRVALSSNEGRAGDGAAASSIGEGGDGSCADTRSWAYQLGASALGAPGAGPMAADVAAHASEAGAASGGPVGPAAMQQQAEVCLLGAAGPAAAVRVAQQAAASPLLALAAADSSSMQPRQQNSSVAAAAVAVQPGDAFSPAKAAPPPPPPKPAGRAAPSPPPPPPGRKAVQGEEAEAAAAAGQAPSGRTPSKPMVKLFWNKLPPSQVQGTVWKQLEGMDAEVDYDLLESEFAATQAARALQAGGASAPAKVSLLPVRRANNVGIFLRKLRLSRQQLRESILKLLGEEGCSGARDLTDEEVGGLLACLATEEEAMLLRGYKGPLEELGGVERFMLEVLAIPELGLRLQALRFGAQFDERAAAVHGAGALLLQACGEVKECTLLAEILKVALVTGNFLNAGNKNGAAAGFQIDALLKLQDVRSTRSRSSTLLHFLAREVARQHPGDASSLKAALPSCQEAARLSMVAMQQELTELNAGLGQVELAGSMGGCRAFVRGMRDFHQRAQCRVQQLVAELAEAEAAFRELGTFLNGQRSTMQEPGAFFGVLAAFAEDLEEAQRENQRADEAAAKRAAAAAAQAAGGKRRASPAAAAGGERASPLRQRDRVLSEVRAFSRLQPGQRKALLTEKGAVERLKALNIQRRHTSGAEQSPSGRRSPAQQRSSMAGLKERPASSTAAHWSPSAIRSRPASPITVQLPLAPPRPATSPAALPAPGTAAVAAGAPSRLARVSSAQEGALEPKQQLQQQQRAELPRYSRPLRQRGGFTWSPGRLQLSPQQQRPQGVETAELQGLSSATFGSSVEAASSSGTAVATEPWEDGEGAGHQEHDGKAGSPAMASAGLGASPSWVAMAGDTSAHLHLSLASSPAAAAPAAAGLRATPPPGSLAQSLSQRGSLVLSPTSTPLGALGRRGSSGNLPPQALSWSSTAAAAGPALSAQAGAVDQHHQPKPQQQEEPAPLSSSVETELHPLPSISPDAAVPVEAEEGAEAQVHSLLSPSPFDAPLPPVGEPLADLLSFPPSPEWAPAAEQHQLQQHVAAAAGWLHRSASCDLLHAAAGQAAAPRRRKHVTFSLPASPLGSPRSGGGAGSAEGLAGERAGAQHSSLDVDRLAGMLRRAAAVQGGAGGQWAHPVPAPAVVAAVVEGEQLGRAGSPTMELLLQSIPTARAALQLEYDEPQWLEGAEEEWVDGAAAVQSGCAPTAGPPPQRAQQEQRSWYDAEVETAMAAVIANAGGSPTGPLGQGMRDSLPGFNPVDPRLRASWADLRRSASIAMPQPLGEGVRASITLLPDIRG